MGSDGWTTRLLRIGAQGGSPGEKRKGLILFASALASADMSFLKKLASRDDLVKETNADHLALVMQNIGHALLETGDELRLEMK